MLETKNYGFKMPSDDEYFDQQAHENSNWEMLDEILTPAADQSIPPVGNKPGKLNQWFSWLTNRITAITGKNWWETPDIDLSTAKTYIDNLNQHAVDTIQHNIPLSITASDKDENGVYRTVTCRKADGTLYMRSILDGGTSPYYTRITQEYYNSNGEVIMTKTWQLTYDENNNIVSITLI